MEFPGLKAVFGFLGFVVLVILIVVIVARGGNDNRASLEPVPSLAEAASSDASFRFIEAGPIVAEEDHFRIEINVSRNDREIIVYRGYNNVQAASARFSNSQAAFEEFLSALDRSGYTTSRRTGFESEAGVCPTNRRYIFESNQFDEDFRRWTTNCREKGSFGGDFTTIRRLFRNQIPEIDAFITETRRETGLQL